MTTIKILQKINYATDNFLSAKQLAKQKKYASYKNRVIALVIDNNKILSKDFTLKNKQLFFECIICKVSHAEKILVTVSKDVTERMMNASIRDEVTAHINKDIAVAMNCHDTKVAIRETCTLRHAICNFLYNVTKKQKFFDFAQDKKQTDIEREKVYAIEKKVAKQKSNLKALKVAKKSTTKK